MSAPFSCLLRRMGGGVGGSVHVSPAASRLALSGGGKCTMTSDVPAAAVGRLACCDAIAPLTGSGGKGSYAVTHREKRVETRAQSASRKTRAVRLALVSMPHEPREAPSADTTATLSSMPPPTHPPTPPFSLLPHTLVPPAHTSTGLRCPTRPRPRSGTQGRDAPLHVLCVHASLLEAGPVRWAHVT